MRYFTLLLVFLASNVFATPITIIFSGEVTDLRISAGEWGPSREIVADSPYESATWNGITIVNGDARIMGTFSFDSEIPYAGGQYDIFPEPFPLQWLFTTEGILFQKTPGRICGPCSFEYDESRVRTHIEYLESATSTSPFQWDYMGFSFNFSDGKFTGGTFVFEAAGFFGGYIQGTIDQALVIGAPIRVPEPSSSLLFMSALLPVWWLRRRRHSSSAA
jgi:hypothetical protein